jgi:hypothetical protein
VNAGQQGHEIMKDWGALGTAHRRRDEVAASIASGRREHDAAQSASSLARWPRIVDAIRTAVAAYNEGNGQARLVVTEMADRQHPSVTIESSGNTIPPLVVTLAVAELKVGSASNDSGPGRWVDLARTDDDTAAYILQEWMERL